MNLTQQHILNLLRDLPLSQIADLNFSTQVTNILTERTREYRVGNRDVVQAPWPFAVAKTAAPTPGKKTSPDDILQQLRKKKVATGSRKKLTIAEQESVAESWAKTNLRPFNIVKMRDTRDGHGIRIVQYVENNKVVCLRYNQVADQTTAKRFPPSQVVSIVEGGVTKYFAKSRDTTVHQMNKVVERYVRDTANGPLMAEGILA